LSIFTKHGEWRENQILIPDWAYFHCTGTTLRPTSKCRQDKKNGALKVRNQQNTSP